MIASVQQEALTALVLGRWEQASRKVAELAEVIPASEFDSQLRDGIRSFSEIFRHVAFWNQYVADILNGKQGDDLANELPLAAYSTRASILEALKRTSADAASALRQHNGPLDGKAVELMMTFVEHMSEHYGQLVVYTRMLGIVPPTSRT
jgi:uncharacterized damage-inducible protein DinB